MADADGRRLAGGHDGHVHVRANRDERSSHSSRRELRAKTRPGAQTWRIVATGNVWATVDQIEQTVVSHLVNKHDVVVNRLIETALATVLHRVIVFRVGADRDYGHQVTRVRGCFHGRELNGICWA